MLKKQFDKAIQYFRKIDTLNPTFRKNIFLLISIAYRKQKNLP